MNLNKPTLIEFELERRRLNYIPPLGSNSFYTIGDGEINILTKRADTDNYRFELLTKSGHVYTGEDTFNISGDINDINKPYEDLIVVSGTELSVNKHLVISKGNANVYGTMDLMASSTLMVKDRASVIFYPGSSFTIGENTKIIVENESSLAIYGTINIHISGVNNLLNSEHITIDSTAVMNVSGIDVPNRTYSMIDYDSDLRDKIIAIYTQNEVNTSYGRMGYTWVAGNPLDHSQVIDMKTLYGENVLGDFKYSVLGIPIEPVADFQIVSNLIIKPNTTLYISDNFKGASYLYPELYVGVIIGNNKIPGSCIVSGTLIVDGENSKITLDRGGSIHIESDGYVYLQNKAIIKNTYADDTVTLFVDGTLVIDDISQISSFTRDNIAFGTNGKIIILNPDTGEKRLLFSTPNGIESSDLYRLFKNEIEHIEYHISNNTGIEVDQYYEFYNRQFVNWYGGRRIEKAIHDGLLVWHDGGFIQLNNTNIPWVDENSSLLEASRLFKTFGSYDEDKLQDAVDRLSYAGAGNIIFRFIHGDTEHEVEMVLKSPKMKNIYNKPMTEMYVLNTEGDGFLYVRNLVKDSSISSIVKPDSRVIGIKNNKAEFSLDG